MRAPPAARRPTCCASAADAARGRPGRRADRARRALLRHSPSAGAAGRGARRRASCCRARTPAATALGCRSRHAARARRLGHGRARCGGCARSTRRLAVDFNHLYLDSGAAGPRRRAPTQARAPQRPPAPAARASASSTAVSRPPTRAARRRSAPGAAAAVRCRAPHGTAVASLLVGRDARFRGAAPGARAVRRRRLLRRPDRRLDRGGGCRRWHGWHRRAGGGGQRQPGRPRQPHARAGRATR